MCALRPLLLPLLLLFVALLDGRCSLMPSAAYLLLSDGVRCCDIWPDAECCCAMLCKMLCDAVCCRRTALLPP